MKKLKYQLNKMAYNIISLINLLIFKEKNMNDYFGEMLNDGDFVEPIEDILIDGATLLKKRFYLSQHKTMV